jgi:octopine/nopaline transport system permease protein
MSFDLSLIADNVPKIALGAGVTLQLLFLSLLIGSLLGVGAVLMRISGSPVLAWPSFAYSYVFRGTPMLVQIFLIYYGLSQFEAVRNSILWPILREPYWCAVIALSLNCGAYTAEILRGGIQGVDHGLHEAGRALGLTPRQRFVHVTAPIAVRLALPAFGNEMISLLKGTALVSMITMNDITGVARNVVSKTFAPYEIFISAAIVYLMITWAIQRGVRLAERHFSRYIRK